MRSKGRSLLIAILVAGATYADIVSRTFGSPAREAQRTVGSADGAVTVTHATRPADVHLRWLVRPYTVRDERDPAKVDVAKLLPAGTRIVEMPRYIQVTLRRGPGVVRTQIVSADVRKPLHRYATRLEEGRPPGAGEVLVSRRLAERLNILDGDDGVRKGATVTLLQRPRRWRPGLISRSGATLRVSGLVRNPTCLSCELLVAPAGSTAVRAARPGSRRDYFYGYGMGDPTYLVDLPAGTSSHTLARDLAARGVALTTRDALAHPERFEADEQATVAVDSLRAFALVALIVGLGLLEIVLLAGTAFAGGARRQVRELGLVAASGGSPRDIRRIVLAQSTSARWVRSRSSTANPRRAT